MLSLTYSGTASQLERQALEAMALRSKCIQVHHLYQSVSIHYAEVTNWPHVLVTYTASLFLTQSLLRSVPGCIDPIIQAVGVSTLWTLTVWWQRKKRHAKPRADSSSSLVGHFHMNFTGQIKWSLLNSARWRWSIILLQSGFCQSLVKLVGHEIGK